MTKSVVPSPDKNAPSGREPRPFLFLEPVQATSEEVKFGLDAVRRLDRSTASKVPAIARALVNFTIALQNRRAIEHGNVQPIQVSVLNRRRRSARAWLNAILAGNVDVATRHAVATQWLPTLCGTGPELERCVQPAAKIIEFVRGAITACIFDEAADNLVPQAKALQVLESVLAVHLSAVRRDARSRDRVRV